MNYRNARSESCPFCRGSLKRVSSTDLWVLTSNSDVIDAVTLAKENLRRFNLYIENLRPFVAPDTHVMLFDYMIWTTQEFIAASYRMLPTPLYIESGIVKFGLPYHWSMACWELYIVKRTTGRKSLEKRLSHRAA